MNTPLPELPALIGMLAQFQAKAQLRMLTRHEAVNDETGGLLTIPQVAQRLKVSTYRAYELARQGLLPSIKLGKAVRVRVSAIDEYLAKLEH